MTQENRLREKAKWIVDWVARWHGAVDFNELLNKHVIGTIEQVTESLEKQLSEKEEELQAIRKRFDERYVTPNEYEKHLIAKPLHEKIASLEAEVAIQKTRKETACSMLLTKFNDSDLDFAKEAKEKIVSLETEIKEVKDSHGWTRCVELSAEIAELKKELDYVKSFSKDGERFNALLNEKLNLDIKVSSLSQKLEKAVEFIDRIACKCVYSADNFKKLVCVCGRCETLKQIGESDEKM